MMYNKLQMNLDENYFDDRKEKARQIYSGHTKIYNPYFKTEIILNSDGFHHIQFSARRERETEIRNCLSETWKMSKIKSNKKSARGGFFVMPAFSLGNP